MYFSIKTIKTLLAESNRHCYEQNTNQHVQNGKNKTYY